MNRIMIISFGLLVFFGSCHDKKKDKKTKETEQLDTASKKNTDLTIVFASCNDQEMQQPLWKAVVANNPHTFIWGGDNVYADTEDMNKMRSDYEKVTTHPDYSNLVSTTNIIGIYDDHDYGKNDAGEEWEYKDEAKEILFDFLGYDSNDAVRNRIGAYHSRLIEIAEGSVKVILLDTRYFRTEMKKSNIANHRYMAWPDAHEGTILGAKQWDWLENELKDQRADFTMIVSSIQFLSKDHGWEKWGNFPSEVSKMYALLENADAKNIFFLSGDRHMAEVSVNKEAGLAYPLVDFTSSGLTRTWITNATEANEYRVSNVVKKLNFGVLLFDFQNQQVTFQIRGENDFLYEEFVQQY